MKCFWKKLLSLGLIMGVLLTSIPSVAAITGDDTAHGGQTSGADSKELFTRSEPTLPEKGSYAPNRLLVTRVDSKMRSMPLCHESIVFSDALFSLDMPKQAPEVMQMNTEQTEKITCTAVNLAEGSDMLAVMRELSQEPGVLAVEVDRLHTLDSVAKGELKEVPATFAPERDPLVAQQTWLEFMGATKAWDMVTAQNKVPGAGVVVAVLDSGITIDHPDLEDRITDGGRQFWLNLETGEVENSGNFKDGAGHGTHVSGMIAGAKNGTGITGVAYGAKILPIKVLGDDGTGYDSGLIKGMLYAAGQVDENGMSTPNGKPRCDIANMSLGGNSGAPVIAYEVVVAAMRKADIFLVVAAGNEETATSYVNPANMYAPYTAPAYVTGAFTVMAMRETPRKNGDYLAYFSNWDSDPYAGAEYTLMAPGNAILSSVNEEGGWYINYGGTSMASPATAGAAALVLGANPGYTAEELWTVLATSGQTRQGKTDEEGKKYSYHMLDVVAALNTKPASVRSVVKGTVTGNWTEVRTLDYINNSALVMPTDGNEMPQIKLTLRGYDGEAYNFAATGKGIEPTSDRVTYLAPGSEAEIVFTLEQMPTTNVFETEIAVTWTNKDGSAGSETVPVKLDVKKAASGSRLLDPDFGRDFYKTQEIELLWIFEDKVDITLPLMPEDTKPATEKPADPELPAILLDYGIYYFGENGSLNVTKSADYGSLIFAQADMLNPQISGDVYMWLINIKGFYKRVERSTIDINGGMFYCTIDEYPNLDLKVAEWIELTTIANSENSHITAGSVSNSTLMNNFTFESLQPGNYAITDITVTMPTDVGTENEGNTSITDSTGFYGNAVIGPAKVLYKDGANAAVPAKASNCYYLPAANKEENILESVPDAINKIECAGDSTVYIEGTSEGPRPAILKSCPTFVISIKRVPGIEPSIRDSHMSYRLVSEFSNKQKKGKSFGYCSYLVLDGSIEAENIVWAEDGLSCTYTVYTSVVHRRTDDIYSLKGLGMPLQYDGRNPIHNRTSEQLYLKMTAERKGDKLEIAWNEPAGYEELKVGKLFCQTLLGEDEDDEELRELALTPAQLGARKYEILNCVLPEGRQYKFSVELYDKMEKPGYKAEGAALYYEPYAANGEDISLQGLKINDAGVLNLLGGETATISLRANKSFNKKNGLKITVLADEKALEIIAVEPNDGKFSGIARDGDKTVIEITPAGIFEGTDSRDQYVFKGDTIAYLTLRGKNVDSEDTVMLHVQDFFGNELKQEDGEPSMFTFSAKTTAVSSGGGDYTPPVNNTTTQTLPDGTLVTTIKNPDGSIQIVYRRPDGVSSTVKTQVKGAASTASISLPAALAGTSVKVPIPVTSGGITTVAVLVGKDGKEQVIPSSFWKDGVLTVPLTGNANIIIRDNAKSFDDVATNHWAADAIAFVTSRELFNGFGKGFQPEDDTTRGMLVTVLARFDGQNTATGARWDSVGTAWAKERGISSGSDMEAAITREQLAVMLYRYAKAEKVKGDLSSFSDAANVSTWAQDAMEWAVKTGILGGANGALNPQGNASRAEVAAMLTRFVANA